MNQSALILLLCLNFIATAILGTLVFKNQQLSQTQTSPPERATHADLNALQTPVTKAAAEIAKLNETVQRFSTSSVQYDFLKREMDQLAIIDQTVAAQAQTTAAAKTEKNAVEIDTAVEKLGKLSQQIKAQLQGRRKTMLQLISSLEKELAELSGPLPQKIQPKPAIAVPPVTPAPVIPSPPSE